MATVKDTFNSAVSEAMKNAELISDNYQKAMVYATIAQALASTGMVSGTAEVAEPKKEEKKTAKPKKTADKLKRQPEEIPAEEEAKEEAPAQKEAPAKEEPKAKEAPAEETQEWGQEWTEDALVAFEKELGFIADFTEKWGVEAANSCLSEFSEGMLTDVSADVNPQNIKAICNEFRKMEAEVNAA